MAENSSYSLDLYWIMVAGLARGDWPKAKAERRKPERGNACGASDQGAEMDGGAMGKEEGRGAREEPGKRRRGEK